MQRRILSLLVGIAFVGVLAATGAWAGSPHFVSCNIVSQTSNSLTVAAKEAGLGDEDQIHVLLEAMRQLRGRRHVHLRLVYHNAQLEAELRRQAVDLGIAEDVEFVGIRDPIELAREYHQADLLVLPSFADCLPSVVTESLLCGTPVVAGGVCGVPDQVGAYGLAVPPGDAVALANAMDAILADRPRWRAAAAEMRAYAERTFKPETMVARHLAMYEELRRGDRVAAKRGAFWVDLAVRLAIEGYWRRGPGHRGDRRRGGPEKATVDAH